MNTLKSAILAIAALASSFCSAQNVTAPTVTGPTYIGTYREVGKFAGQIAVGFDFVTYGISVGTYDDNPDLIVTELVISAFSKGYVDINENSKFILKVNGDNMILSTPHGTNWVGAHDSFVGTAGVAGLIVGAKQLIYRSTAHYPITGDQLEKLLKYGFTKYRFQIKGKVMEGELSERKLRRMVENLNEAYNEAREEQATISNKVNDLSDF